MTNDKPGQRTLCEIIFTRVHMCKNTWATSEFPCAMAIERIS